MARGKQWVFSARTTEKGLEILQDFKERLGVSWDDLVIDAVNAHHGMDVPKPPRAERKPEAEEPKAEPRAKNPKPVHETLAQPKVEGIEGGESAPAVAGEGER
jgi:hypothetical protein